MTSRLDRDVGKIVDLVDKLGLSKNTIIMFSSDNGPTPAGGADPEYFDGNGIYKGIKRDLYEGGIRAPFIARWPEKIKAGSRSDHISAHWDLMATVSELAGTKPAPNHTGVSFAPSLLGRGEQRKHDYLYWEFYERGGKQAIRKDNLKAVRLNRSKSGADGPWEIYDLKNDPGEETNLAKDRPEFQKIFNEIAAHAATDSDLFKWKVGPKKKKK